MAIHPFTLEPILSFGRHFSSSNDNLWKLPGYYCRPSFRIVWVYIVSTFPLVGYKIIHKSQEFTRCPHSCAFLRQVRLGTTYTSAILRLLVPLYDVISNEIIAPSDLIAYGWQACTSLKFQVLEKPPRMDLAPLMRGQHLVRGHHLLKPQFVDIQIDRRL